MKELIITKAEAKRYLLCKQGLLGPHQFQGKTGILDFIDQAGCIQFDPVDVIGRNADLTLQARIEQYDKNDLSELLYQDRLLVDGYDKMMSIYPARDWHHLQPLRSKYSHRDDNRYKELLPHAEVALKYIESREFVSSIEMESDEHISWGYGSAKKSRAVLDLLFYQGKIVVHHKERARRFYAARSHYFGPDETVFETDEQQMDWHILRRIGAVGLLWDRNSDALLGISQLNAKSRAATFKRLCDQGLIQKLAIAGVASEFYIRQEDVATLELSKTVIDTGRIEFIAPLDPLIWDRKLIALLFDFDYRWEIYTPKEKRVYGHYVLPVIWGTDFVGRIEFAKENTNLVLKQLWVEPNQSIPQADLRRRIHRFAQFNKLSYLPKAPSQSI